MVLLVPTLGMSREIYSFDLWKQCEHLGEFFLELPLRIAILLAKELDLLAYRDLGTTSSYEWPHGNIRLVDNSVCGLREGFLVAPDAFRRFQWAGTARLCGLFRFVTSLVVWSPRKIVRPGASRQVEAMRLVAFRGHRVDVERTARVQVG